jgi:hypothetical protein
MVVTLVGAGVVLGGMKEDSDRSDGRKEAR